MAEQDVDRQAQIRLRHFMETYNAMVNVDGHRAAVPTFVVREMARLQTAEQRLRAALEKARHDLDCLADCEKCEEGCHQWVRGTARSARDEIDKVITVGRVAERDPDEHDIDNTGDCLPECRTCARKNGNANAKPKDFLNTPISDEPYTFLEPVVLGPPSALSSEQLHIVVEKIRSAVQSRAQAQIDLRWCINCETWGDRESAQAPLVCPTCSHETTSYAALKRAVAEFETAVQPEVVVRPVSEDIPTE